jgi:RNA-binding protein
MDSIVKIGKQGITDQLIKAIGTALEDHELIKVKFVDHKDEKNSMVPQIAEKCSAEI